MLTATVGNSGVGMSISKDLQSEAEAFDHRIRERGVNNGPRLGLLLRGETENDLNLRIKEL